MAVPTYSSSNPLVASVNPETGRVTINAVGTTQVEVALEQTPTSDAISKSYVLSVLQPEGFSEAQGAAFVEITIPDDHAFATFCYLYPIDFSGATDDCRTMTSEPSTSFWKGQMASAPFSAQMPRPNGMTSWA